MVEALLTIWLIMTCLYAVPFAFPCRVVGDHNSTSFEGHAIDPHAVQSGHVDLRETLVALNHSGAARSMQQAIARHAHSLVYGLQGAYAGDAVDTLVTALAEALRAPPGSPKCTKILPTWRCMPPSSPQQL